MRQFDVIVLDENTSPSDKWIPPFEDPALGWFRSSDWNKPLQSINAEWVVVTHPAVKIDRDFLNNLAEVTEGFPMVDAFAPRLKFKEHFYGGMLLHGAKGFVPISENEKMRYVSASNPLIAVFSSRIIQRTGLFDLELPPKFRLVDYALRMAHAGGKMFSVPYLVTTLDNDPASLVNGLYFNDKNAVAPLWEIYYKTLPASFLLGFTLRHPTMFLKFLGIDKGKKRRQFKRDKATSLSKLTADYLKEISL